MKKIGIYDPYLDDCGGGEKYMLTIAEVLSKQHEVSVFWDNKEDLDLVASRFSLDLSKVKLASNIFSSKVSFLNRFFKSKKYDAIILLSDGSIPLVHSKLFLHLQRPLTRLDPSFFDKLKIKRVNKFFCNSQFTKSYIDKTYKLNSDVLYPPVTITPKKVKKENIILHVGRFRVYDTTVGVKDYKKQYVMINVFKEMVDHGLKSWKLIMGVSVKEEDAESFNKMKDEARGYPIEFKINKDNAELWKEYSRAKIYWHASGYGEDLIKHPERAEHFGISTVEAMGAGAVPVVINSGGQKEIVEDGVNGLLWSKLSELKEETLILINHKGLLEDLGKSAKLRAKDFSKEKFEKKIIEMMDS